MAFQSRGPRGLSPSVSLLLQPLASYGQFLYLDRGYAFFAPDPGPSHLLRVELKAKQDGNDSAAKIEERTTSTEIRTYPDLNQQWPRLLYHRHFMLAEFLNDSYQPKLPAEAASLVGPELTIEELQAWRKGRQRYERIADSMRNHLRSEFENHDIQLDRLEHLLPDFVTYAVEPSPLNDPPTYVLLEDIPITLETLLGAPPQSLPEPGAREAVPVPSGQRIETERSSPEAPQR